MKKYILTIGIAILSIVSFAQIKVHDNGNAIIGSTSTPSSGYKFQIVGQSAFTATNTSITSAAMIRGNNGYSTATTPDFTYYGDTTTGIFHYAQSILGFTTAGSEKARFHSNGNFGVATTTPPARFTIYSGKSNSTGLSVKNGDVDLILTEDIDANAGKIQVMKEGSASTIGTTPYDLLLQPQGGKTAIGTTSPTNNYLLTMLTNGTLANGLNLTLSGATTTAYGLNITTSNSKYRGILVSNTTSSAGVFYGIGTTLTAGTTTEAYLGYRSSTPKTYGIYALGGDYTAFFKGKTVVTSATTPTSTSDFEVQNTTSGTGYPATVSLRQTNSLTSTGNILANINFGDNNTTNAQANIQVTRDASSSSTSDLPTAITFSTIADGSSTLSERIKIKNNGYIGVGTSSPNSRITINQEEGYASFRAIKTNPADSFTYNVVSEVNAAKAKSISSQYGGTDKFLVWGDGHININCNYYNSPYWLTVYGDAYANGQWIASDANFKQDISDIESPFEKLNQIKGKKYEYNTDAYPEMNFLDGYTYGVIAQELQAVLPELVRADSAGNLAVNYNGLIPFLIEAVKEQQTQIETLRNDLNTCCQKADEKSSIINTSGNNQHATSNNSYLLQNRPNPFANETVIEYFIAENTANASIMIFDLNGKLLKTNNITSSGKGSITIFGNELSQGMYLYSLVINGEERDTKRMILSE